MTTTMKPETISTQHLSENYYYSIRPLKMTELGMYEHLMEQYVVARTADLDENTRLALILVGAENLWKFANLFNMKQRHYSEYMDGVKTQKKKIVVCRRINGNSIPRTYENVEDDYHCDEYGEKVEEKGSWMEGDTPRFYYKDYPISPTYFTLTPNGTFVLKDSVVERMRKGTRTAYLKKEKMLDIFPPLPDETKPVTEDKELKCCLCPGTCKGAGNTPAPLNTTDGARCCDTCNVMRVLPARYTEGLSPCKGECEACKSAIHLPKPLDVNACSYKLKVEPPVKKKAVKKTKKVAKVEAPSS